MPNLLSISLSIVDRVGLEPTIVPYFFTCRLLRGLEPDLPVPRTLYPFTTYPFFFDKDKTIILINQNFFIFFFEPVIGFEPT